MKKWFACASAIFCHLSIFSRVQGHTLTLSHNVFYDADLPDSNDYILQLPENSPIR
jgi:hypothetical protein